MLLGTVRRENFAITVKELAMLFLSAQDIHKDEMKVHNAIRTLL